MFKTWFLRKNILTSAGTELEASRLPVCNADHSATRPRNFQNCLFSNERQQQLNKVRRDNNIYNNNNNSNENKSFVGFWENCTGRRHGYPSQQQLSNIPASCSGPLPICNWRSLAGCHVLVLLSRIRCLWSSLRWCQRSRWLRKRIRHPLLHLLLRPLFLLGQFFRHFLSEF